MKASLKEAVEQIKTAGFSHIKVELEGDLGRDGERSCYECDGEGREHCEHCSGNGYVRYEDDTGEEHEAECDNCEGDGRIECYTCEGSGYGGQEWSDEDCDEFMKTYVMNKQREVFDRLTYGRFYEDGSVDSEFTFTVHIDNVEDVLIWMEAFKALAEEVGDGSIDVGGAGLHIALIPQEAEGHYPVAENTLPHAKVNNFCSEMTKLLPALFFLASSNHQSRDLEYRHASVDSSKYNAISHHDYSCFEYRVFETCYDNTSVFLDYVKVIANTLKFYADPNLKVKALGKRFGFTNGDSCARFYNTPEQLRILNATVKHLKPKDKSYKQLKEERGVHYTIKSLTQQYKAKTQKLTADYAEYQKRWEETNKRELTPRELERVDSYMAYEGMTRNDAERQVRENRTSPLRSLDQFIRDNLGMSSFDEVVRV